MPRSPPTRGSPRSCGRRATAGDSACAAPCARVMDGRFAEAEELAAAALTVGQSVQPETAANFFARADLLRPARAGSTGRARGRVAGRRRRLSERAGLACGRWPACTPRSAAELEAEREFEHAASADFHDVSEDDNWLAAVAFLGEVCAFLGDRRARRRCSMICCCRTPSSSSSSGSPRPATAPWRACSACWRRRWVAGTTPSRHFEQALAMNRRLGARPFVARTQLEYAAMLLAAADAGARAATSRCAPAQRAARRGARQRPRAGHGRRRSQGSALTRDATSAPAVPPDNARRRRRTQTRVSAGTAGPTRGPVDVATDPTDNVFRQEADYWIVAFGGQTCRLKDAKGLRYIALLLREPNRPFHVTELLRADATRGDVARSATTAIACATCRRSWRRPSASTTPAAPPGRRPRSTRSPASSPGGWARPSAARMRRTSCCVSRVTKAIKAAARKISARHPALGHHLRTTIRTGSVCSYVPDPTKPMRWNVGA